MPNFIQIGSDFFNVSDIIRVSKPSGRFNSDVVLVTREACLGPDGAGSYSKEHYYTADSSEAAALLSWVRDNSLVLHSEPK